MLKFNQLKERNEVVTPREARGILSADNSQLKGLCQKASLIPKKDRTGNTYFSKSDIEVLKKVKDLWEKSKIVDNGGVPMKAIVQQESPNNVQTSLTRFERNIIDKITKVIDEKMDGIDEVVIELIRAKTENESLRNKLNDLNKENYKCKNELQSYKHVVAGFYVKKEVEEFIL